MKAILKKQRFKAAGNIESESIYKKDTLPGNIKTRLPRRFTLRRRQGCTLAPVWVL